MLRKLRIECLERRILLSATSWKTTVGSGNWNDANDWTNGIPTATSSASIPAPATVTIPPGQSASVGSLTIDSNATLNLPTVDTVNPATNWLSDSGFESPAVSNNMTTPTSPWSYWNSSYLSTQYAYAGSQSLEITDQNSGVTQVFANTKTQTYVTPGESYTESVYAMMPSNNPLTGGISAQMQFFFYNSSNKMIGNYSPPNQIVILSPTSEAGGPLAGSVGGEGWNFYTTTAVAPAGATQVYVQLAIYAYSSTYSGAVYFASPEFGPSTASASSLATASIINNGTLLIGSPNTVTVSGNYTQSSTGTLDVQLGAMPSINQYGTLTINGSAALAGTLKADLVDGYTPLTTDAFTPITYASASGSFSSYQLPSGSGYQFDPAVTFTNVDLSAVPTATVTTSVSAATSLHATANLLGINTGYPDSYATTSETAQMTSAAGLDLFRYPGGSATDEGFHFNLSTNDGDPDANSIAQFAQMVESDGASGMITIDYGSGSPQEAAAELAYLIGSPKDTTEIGMGIESAYQSTTWTDFDWQTVGFWASLRGESPLAQDDGLNFLRISHPAPFTSITYWEVGNEEYGDWETDNHGNPGPSGESTGAPHDPATYVAFAAQFATFAAEITKCAKLPDILIGIDSGDPTGYSDNDWTQNVLADGAAIGFVPNFISDHSYAQEPGTENDLTLLDGTVTDPASTLDWSTRYADYESLLQSTLSVSQAAGVQIMATEYNSVSYNPGKQTTSLVNGLYVANSLGSLLDSGYSAAYIWNLRNYYQSGYNDSNALYGWRTSGDYGVLGTDPSQPPASGPYVAYPSYYALQLASKIIMPGGEVVSAASNYGDLDVYAVTEADGDLELMVVNTNAAAAITDQISLAGFQPANEAQIWQYGETQDTAQSLSSTGASALASSTFALNGATFAYSFPAYSMTVLDLNNAFASIAVTPQAGQFSATGAEQFTAEALDQLGIPLVVQPTFTWSLAGPGNVTSGGLYTTAYTTGAAAVTASSGTVTASVSLTLPGAAQFTASGPTSWNSAAWTGSVSGGAIDGPGLRGVAGDSVSLSGPAGGSIALNGVSPILAAVNLGGSVTIAAGSGGTLQLSNGSSTASIDATSGSPTIAAPVALMSNTVVTAAAGYSLSIAGGISGAFESLTLSGPGTLQLSGANSYGGGTFVTGGTLVLSSAAALQSGTSLIVGANAALFGEASPAMSEVTAAVATKDDVSTAVALQSAPSPSAHAAFFARFGGKATDGPIVL